MTSVAEVSVHHVEALLVEDAQDLGEVVAALEDLAVHADHLVGALALGLGIILLALSMGINGAAFMVKDTAERRLG